MDVLVVGSGGLAREFTDWFSDQINVVGYSTRDRTEYDLHNMIGECYGDDVTPEVVGTKHCILAIGRPKLKKAIYQQYLKKGFTFPSFVHRTSVVSSSIKMGDGVIISPQCVVGLGVTLETGVYLNFGVNIGHESVLGEFSHLNPGVNVAGCCRIGAQTLLGSGSTIIEKKQLGDFVTVASGSVVFNSINEGSTVWGNPAKKMRVFDA